MDFELKHLVILLIALWVTFQLPTWSRKLVPEGISGWKVPSALKLVAQFFIAYLLAYVGWGSIAGAIDDGLVQLREIAATEQISRVIKLPEILLAVGAIFLTLWLIKVVFTNLGDAKKLSDSLIAIVILVLVFALYNTIWVFLRKYLLLNLEGSELLFQTQAWNVVENFFKK
jgi:hypothetical protein